MTSDISYCRGLVEQYDPDRYILTLAAPVDARLALWALYAFNHEIAKTREVTRDTHAGHIRLAWWREALEKFYNGGAMPAHDVARALGEAIRDYDLPHNAFERLLDARMLDLDNKAPPSLDALCAYADATNTPLIEMVAKILNTQAPPGLGGVWGMTGIIRALPYYARQNRCLLPLPMLHDIGLMPEQFHHLTSSPALAAAVKKITECAQMHLKEAQSDHRFFKAHIKMAEVYLKNIARAQNDPFDQRVQRRVPFLGLRVLF